jgi:crossover junction endodeoxyribonuclease RusA
MIWEGAELVLDLWIPGNPIAKGRPRVLKGGWSYTPKATREAEKAIATQAKISLLPYWRVDTSSDWAISYTFHCKSRVRGDGDNLQKLVQDALQGVLFANDKRVVEWHGRIASEGSLEPGIAILAWRLGQEVGIKPSAPLSSHLGSC